MRIEKSYHRADLRRLSTESYVKQEGKGLSTQWLWYRKEESGDWIKYGVTTGESDLKQEDLETAFLRREGNYTFTRNGQEFRLQFFMNPMCEKSFRPYSKKTVRRRPAYESPEDIKTLLRGNVEKKSWFSLRNLFRWR
ncbi:protein mono-ADP-ribosyltransferase PARP12-like [Porites lutea]|uniref:protein mono-ADP-ribosyltransferase PARP12-like n=1 Tax=Porites lutea TaxID=51062 RepID=UPI003CC67765